MAGPESHKTVGGTSHSNITSNSRIELVTVVCREVSMYVSNKKIFTKTIPMGCCNGARPMDYG